MTSNFQVATTQPSTDSPLRRFLKFLSRKFTIPSGPEVLPHEIAILYEQETYYDRTDHMKCLRGDPGGSYNSLRGLF